METLVNKGLDRQSEKERSEGLKLNSKKLLILLYILITISLVSENTHIIKEGETLYRLSQRYKTTVDEIVKLNNITDITSIGVGAKIKIPGNETQKFYTVVKGDTLFSISKKFNLPISKINEYNNLKNGSIISLGQKLILSKDANELGEVVPKPEEVVKPTIKTASVPYWPLVGEIRKYSGRIQGVEIKGEPGDYIKAVSKGKVIWYDSYKGIGKVVLIEGDNGYDYLYGTKESLNVKMGVNINAGDRLGRLKENNTSIIFSVFKNGKPLNDISGAPR